MCQKFKSRETTRVEPKIGLLFSLDKKKAWQLQANHEGLTLTTLKEMFKLRKYYTKQSVHLIKTGLGQNNTAIKNWIVTLLLTKIVYKTIKLFY